MVKAVNFTVLLFVAIILTGCAQSIHADPFAVFDGEFSVKAELVCEGNTSVFIYDSSTRRIEFESPSELCGYAVYEDDGRVYLAFDQIQVPLSEYSDGIYEICRAVFSADSDVIKSIGTKKQSGKTLTAVDAGDFECCFDSDGLPVFASGTVDGIEFEMSFSEFSEVVK